MGVSVRGKAVLGFRVSRNDFMEKVAVEPTCEKGHLQESLGPFCSQDGTKFEARNNERPTKALKALYQFIEERLDENLTDPYAEFAEFAKFYDTETSPLQIITEKWDKSFAVVGLRLVTLSEYSKFADSVNDTTLKKIRARVEAMRAVLSMEDRPIELFFEVDLS